MFFLVCLFNILLTVSGVIWCNKRLSCDDHEVWDVGIFAPVIMSSCFARLNLLLEHSWFLLSRARPLPGFSSNFTNIRASSHPELHITNICWHWRDWLSNQTSIHYKRVFWVWEVTKKLFTSDEHQMLLTFSDRVYRLQICLKRTHWPDRLCLKRLQSWSFILVGGGSCLSPVNQNDLLLLISLLCLANLRAGEIQE